MAAIFDPEVLHRIAREVGGRPPASNDAMVASVREALRAAYPGHVHGDDPPQWIWSLAGGITGVMTLLHASLSEYVLIFGAPVGSDGFSGRYRIDIYDYVLAGEMATYREASPGTPVISGPGEWTLLPRGGVKGVRLGAGTWLLEYARGPIATCLPMALGDAVFSALDGTTIVDTFRAYGRLVARELMQGKI